MRFIREQLFWHWRSPSLRHPLQRRKNAGSTNGAVVSGQLASEFVINGRGWVAHPANKLKSLMACEDDSFSRIISGERSQISQVTATNGNAVTWQTTYTWTGGNSNVKSLNFKQVHAGRKTREKKRLVKLINETAAVDANLDLRVGVGKTLTSIASIPTSWQWTYSRAPTIFV
ncbi:hypothetical protein B0H14DRAFT_2620493 [Mycena olivaceomarginata]|nr:hypothetical protein B0H14DRAFT_2620493 [Mycena olivaceomarginata]